MDDLLTGADFQDEVADMVTEAVTIMDKGGFPLAKSFHTQNYVMLDQSEQRQKKMKCEKKMTNIKSVSRHYPHKNSVELLL